MDRQVHGPGYRRPAQMAIQEFGDLHERHVGRAAVIGRLDERLPLGHRRSGGGFDFTDNRDELLLVGGMRARAGSKEHKTDEEKPH